MMRWTRACAFMVALAGAAAARGDAPTGPPLGAAPVPSAPEEPRRAALVELLERSGSRRALEQLPGTIGQLVMKAEKLNDAMASALLEALAPRPFVSDVTAHMGRAFDAARGQKLLAWYRTPLGRRIVSLSEAADREPARLAKRVAELQRLPPPPERLELFEKLVENDDPVGLLTLAAQSLFEGLLAFISKVVPPERQPQARLHRRQVSSPQDASAFVPVYAANLESVSTADLRKYLAFTTSDEALWFDKLEREAIAFAMRRAGVRMGKAILRFAIRIPGSL